MNALTRLVIGSAAGGLLGGAAFLGLEAATAHKASAESFQNREATVFIKNDALANRLGTRFLEECEATQRSSSAHVEVICWGSF